MDKKRERKRRKRERKMERKVLKVGREHPLATAACGDAKKVSMNSAMPHENNLTVSGGPQTLANLELRRFVK